MKYRVKWSIYPANEKDARDYLIRVGREILSIRKQKDFPSWGEARHFIELGKEFGITFDLYEVHEKICEEERPCSK